MIVAAHQKVRFFDHTPIQEWTISIIAGAQRRLRIVTCRISCFAHGVATLAPVCSVSALTAIAASATVATIAERRQDASSVVLPTAAISNLHRDERHIECGSVPIENVKTDLA